MRVPIRLLARQYMHPYLILSRRFKTRPNLVSSNNHATVSLHKLNTDDGDGAIH